MTARLRLLVALLCTGALVGLFAPALASTDEPAATPKHEVVLSRAAGTALPTLVRAPGPTRSDGPPTGRSVGMVLAFAAGMLAVGTRSRHARRIADAGDSWRSLLLGAPPVLASF